MTRDDIRVFTRGKAVFVETTVKVIDYDGKLIVGESYQTRANTQAVALRGAEIEELIDALKNAQQEMW